MNKLVVFNWKENPETLKKASELVEAVCGVAMQNNSAEVVIAPPAVFLSDVAEKLHEKKSVVKLGAQDVSLFEGGAHTGEISSQMLKNLGVSYCIVGHSERRAMGEDDETILQKIKELFGAGIAPILCVGESERVSQEDAWEFVQTQLQAVFPKTFNPQPSTLGFVVAYEPIWAIGGDKEVDLDHANFVIKKIKQFLYTNFRIQASVLYGGSVHTQNIEEVFSRDISGVLVGSASLREDDVEKIIASAR